MSYKTGKRWIKLIFSNIIHQSKHCSVFSSCNIKLLLAQSWLKRTTFITSVNRMDGSRQTYVLVWLKIKPWSWRTDSWRNSRCNNKNISAPPLPQSSSPGYSSFCFLDWCLHLKQSLLQMNKISPKSKTRRTNRSRIHRKCFCLTKSSKTRSKVS